MLENESLSGQDPDLRCTSFYELTERKGEKNGVEKVKESH